ncbi:TIR domain-containing protein [Methanolapillus millepedarum]
MSQTEPEDILISPTISDSEITVILIGQHTFENQTCLSEIRQCFESEKAFLSVYLDNKNDTKADGKVLLGKNPLDLFYFEYKDKTITFGEGTTVFAGKLKSRFLSKEVKAKASDFTKTYDYVLDKGSENIGGWIRAELKKKNDFFAECDKITPKDWDAVLKLTAKGGSKTSGMFLYYYWLKKPQIDQKVAEPGQQNDLPDAESGL